MSNKINLKNIQAIAIDMDGVLWLGDTPLPGLAKFFDFLHRREIPYTLATNNASKTPLQYQAKLAKFNVTIDSHHVMTSSLATAAYLQRELSVGSPIYVIGGQGIQDALRQAGYRLLSDAGQQAEAVVVGIDFNLTYDKLKYATLHIQRGARFVGTNGDLTFPAEEGDYPGAGAILAALEAATQVKPVTIGKPERLMFEIAMQKMGSQPENTAMLGDRLETDILGAQRAGLATLLVTTGVDNEESIAIKGIEPDRIFGGLEELVDAWQAEIAA
jgi:4-nitrophenyl phosphatase